MNNRRTIARTGAFACAMLYLLLALNACAQPDSSITRISLQRTACFGVCPVYTVTIYPDGLVEFQGDRFVEFTGEHSARVSPENFRRLAAYAEDIGFFALNDEYRVRREPDGTVIAVSDLPSRITTVTTADQEKSVLNYFAGPEALEQFELLIDEMTASAQWIGAADAVSF